MASRIVTALAAGFTLIGVSGAFASGPVPFYGYSPYFGGPSPYYTYDDDVQASSTQSYGMPGFGTRVYARGGPFWHKTAHPATLRAVRERHDRRRRVVLRRRG